MVESFVRTLAFRSRVFRGLSPVVAAATLASALTLLSSPAQAQSYSVGETVEMHIGSGPIWRPCKVIDNDLTQPVMRLKCPEYNQNNYWQGAGEYVVAREPTSVRKLGSGGGTAAKPSAQAAARSPVRPPQPQPGAGGGLRIGEYACQ